MIKIVKGLNLNSDMLCMPAFEGSLMNIDIFS